MTELKTVFSEALNESNKAHLINSMSLVIILIENGIIDEEEYLEARIRATSIVDQLFEARREEQESEFREENPEYVKFHGNPFSVE